MTIPCYEGTKKGVGVALGSTEHSEVQTITDGVAYTEHKVYRHPCIVGQAVR